MVATLHLSAQLGPAPPKPSAQQDAAIGAHHVITGATRAHHEIVQPALDLGWQRQLDS
jgi:hypothetical protein